MPFNKNNLYTIIKTKEVDGKPLKWIKFLIEAYKED